MLCEPTVRLLRVKLPDPAESVPLPKTVEPSLKVTVPVGVPEPVEVIAAVSVSACPKATGLGLLVIATVGKALPTVKLRLPEPEL